MILLKESPLFADISEENIQKLYKCIRARERKIERDSFVIRAGDDVRLVYMILSGNMHIIDEDFWGNRTIVESMRENTFFGEAYFLASTNKYLVSVVAAQDSTILEMNPEKLFKICTNSCSCHEQIIENTLHILSEKIVRLTEKLGHIVQRTTKEKILSYLSKCAQLAENDAFDIPYSRQQLADYLCVERSALSHELSRLNREGMIRYRKNHFELLHGVNGQNITPY